jgi:predicted DNA-binding ribbon-helix-helix protein
MKPRKRSLTIAGHRTSISLEEPFWQAMSEAAAARGVSPSTLVAEIDGSRGETSLSSAIRLYLLEYYRKQIAQGSSGGG